MFPCVCLAGVSVFVAVCSHVHLVCILMYVGLCVCPECVPVCVLMCVSMCLWGDVGFTVCML